MFKTNKQKIKYSLSFPLLYCKLTIEELNLILIVLCYKTQLNYLPKRCFCFEFLPWFMTSSCSEFSVAPGVVITVTLIILIYLYDSSSWSYRMCFKLYWVPYSTHNVSNTRRFFLCILSTHINNIIIWLSLSSWELHLFM